ncbi:hypothetical protein FTO74_09120 [Granulicella sp. WH15]|uniref:hypothetical protein n=1 Tax=Granulicella sp. WH15 TaxID=2602070 RepID=UPI001366B0CC|nr:hypothetical protein [Granulicella sp. WH15]QHN03511.1 hypothetical protein FTO74_09120 [Granulicella sp. WH15]
MTGRGDLQVQAGLPECVVDAVHAGRNIPVRPDSDGDPGATASGTNYRRVRSIQFAVQNVER